MLQTIKQIVEQRQTSKRNTDRYKDIKQTITYTINEAFTNNATLQAAFASNESRTCNKQTQRGEHKCTGMQAHI